MRRNECIVRQWNTENRVVQEQSDNTSIINTCTNIYKYVNLIYHFCNLRLLCFALVLQNQSYEIKYNYTNK
jgi:hypothetical protein